MKISLDTIRRQGALSAMLFIILFSFSSCVYYRVSDYYTYPSRKAEYWSNILVNQRRWDRFHNRISKKERSCFISQAGVLWSAEMMQIGRDSISFHSIQLMPLKAAAIEEVKNRRSQRVKIGEKMIYTAIIIHLSDDVLLSEGFNRITLSEVEKISLYDKDILKTVSASLGPTVLAAFLYGLVFYDGPGNVQVFQ